MNRREGIRQAIFLLGGVLSAPTLLAIQNHENQISLDASFALNKIQRKVLAELSEIIIPRTETAGAKDAGVPTFIEMMIKDCYKSQEKTNFVNGLNQLIAGNFLKQNLSQRNETVKALEVETKESMKKKNVKQTKIGDNEDKEIMNEDNKGVPFWRIMKELTLLGYFTSEKGIIENFDYQPVPGKLEVIKLKSVQKPFEY
jgi:hypothetical protein